MFVMFSILMWLNRVISLLRCKLNGHSNITVIEVYEEIDRPKNYSGTHLKNLTLTKPYFETTIRGKLRCNTCGRVFIGFIVKNNVRQWTRHDAGQ
jgi:hypothetical protein